MTDRLAKATIIAFWMPRYAHPTAYEQEFSKMHYVMFGQPGKAVIGFPDQDKFSKVFQKERTATNVPIFRTMDEVIAEAVRLARH
jgi:hypothetical protein